MTSAVDCAADVRSVLEHALAKRELPPALIERVFSAMLRAELSPAQTGAVLIALRSKGETPNELVHAAKALRSACVAIAPNVGDALLDTCGTGGDGLATFNISTAVAIVAAACGVPVAKHGNRAVSSQAGSADVLEALGVIVDLEPERVTQSIEDVGIGFLFAPRFHPAMRHVAAVRRELGVRTLFNLIGPLSNPARATHQLVGVYDAALVVVFAEVLRELGAQRAWVVHGEGGLDEVSPSGVTHVAEVRSGQVTRFTLSPSDFGMTPIALSDLKGGDAKANAAIIQSILRGDAGAPRTAVLINTAAALVVAERAPDLHEGVRRAEHAIDSGAARAKLAQWVDAARARN